MCVIISKLLDLFLLSSSVTNEEMEWAVLDLWNEVFPQILCRKQDDSGVLVSETAVLSSLLPPVDKPATFLSLSLWLNMSILIRKKLPSVTEKSYACFGIIMKQAKSVTSEGCFYYMCTHDSSAEKKEIK